MKTSVVIVTKDRVFDLLECLGSLLSQTVDIDELIIIDNNSQDTTPEVVKNFAQNVVFPVRYILEEKVGFPFVYNRGLREARYSWVAFLDDDCVADEIWLESIHKAQRKYPFAAALLGDTQTYYKNNFFSLLTYWKDSVWKHSVIIQSRIADLEVLDNKNIVYNKDFLTKNNIQFSENERREFFGASEDCDLGMKLQQAGGQAFFIPRMMAVHKDPCGRQHFYSKLIFMARAHAQYEKKWLQVRSRLPEMGRGWYWKFTYLQLFFQRTGMGIFRQFFFSLHLMLAFCIVQLVKKNSQYNLGLANK